jgi:hypothetical protein
MLSTQREGDGNVADQREKTVSYRRASWLPEVSGITLEGCIRDAHLNLKTIDDRTIGFGGSLTRSAKQKNATPAGLFLHLTTETPGESASLVPHPKPRAQELDLRVEAPPGDGEWLDGDAFLYVRSDHVCLCSTGIRDGAINHFLHEFFKKAHLRKDSALAANVVSHSDKTYDYSILTKTGQRISPEEIFIRTKVQIDKEGKTVHRDKAWRELQYFYESLKTSGALEE